MNDRYLIGQGSRYNIYFDGYVEYINSGGQKRYSDYNYYRSAKEKIVSFLKQFGEIGEEYSIRVVNSNIHAFEYDES